MDKPEDHGLKSSDLLRLTKVVKSIRKREGVEFFGSVIASSFRQGIWNVIAHLACGGNADLYGVGDIRMIRECTAEIRWKMAEAVEAAWSEDKSI